MCREQAGSQEAYRSIARSMSDESEFFLCRVGPPFALGPRRQVSGDTC